MSQTPSTLFQRHYEKVAAHANRALVAEDDDRLSPSELLEKYKSFLKKEEHRIRLAHRQCALRREGGLEVAAKRSQTLDIVLKVLFDRVNRTLSPDTRIALVATGGYGRGFLNPGSDIDVCFLHPGKVTQDLRTMIESVTYMLYDVGMKVGKAVRSVKETFEAANDKNDPRHNETKSSLIDARFLTGDERIWQDFKTRFHRECIAGKEGEYLESRRLDLIKRHKEHHQTVHLKEPHLKNGCGGLRDFHNLLWISWVKTGTMNLDELVAKGVLSDIAAQELRRAHDFLMLVRNDLHYSEKFATEILTLRAQGVIAKNLAYQGKKMTQRAGAFMKDYYHHARNIYQHNESVMELFELEMGEKTKSRLLGFLRRRKDAPKREHFDGFYSEDGFIFPESDKTFAEDSGRLMGMFQHTQLRDLKLSPQIRKLFKNHFGAINKTFRYKKSNREIFEAILSRKGDVGRVLRQMHRVTFLGRWLPEFQPLTDLVQHEFFHSFTADEHTLQTVEKLDELIDTEDPKLELQRRLLQELEDPYILYLALIMHDTGRGEGAAQHSFASEELTDQVCRRLQIQGKRRQMLMFLVAHHLTLWQIATTKDPEDPKVVAEFARIVKNKEWLDALFIMTYADASATYEHGWSDWKESLLRQLYHNTLMYFRDQAAFQSRMQRPGVELRRTVEDALDDSYGEEISAHFADMPDRYWHVRDAEQVVEHVKLFRKFFRQLAKDDRAAALTPVIKWTDCPERGCSELALVSWDRHLLLAKVAGALAAHNLNILSADLFLRRDNLVLDLFRVCTTDLQPVRADKIKESFLSILTKAFTGEPVDFPALIQRNTSYLTKTMPAEWEKEFHTRLVVSNSIHPEFTVVELQAIDRIGLLHAIFQVIGGCGLEITNARINTEKGAAIDSFYVVGDFGKKVPEAKLAELKEQLQGVIGLKS